MQTTGSDSRSTDQYRILVMDDESHIRDISKKMLEKFGYAVDLAEDGETAVELYKADLARDCPPDLVIMDLSVPGRMGGKEAAEIILSCHAEAKIVISSGFSEDPVMSDPEAHGLKGIIPKPYRLNELKEMVTRILNT